MGKRACSIALFAAACFGFSTPNINQNQERKSELKTNEIVRAWKDEDYRDTLTAEDRAELPEHPAGVIEFEQPELEDETLFRGKITDHCTHTYKIPGCGK